MKPPRCFVTANPGKLEEARRITGWPLEQAALDLPEIQSLALEEILFDKGARAWAALGVPLLVEDTGLFLDALGGFPGPLVKWLERAAGVAAIPRLLPRGVTRAAHAVCAAMAFDGRRAVAAVGRVEGTIASAPRGGNGFGWDSVFIPRGTGRTYAEMTGPQKDAISHRRLALTALASALRH